MYAKSSEAREIDATAERESLSSKNALLAACAIIASRYLSSGYEVKHVIGCPMVSKQRNGADRGREKRSCRSLVSNNVHREKITKFLYR